MNDQPLKFSIITPSYNEEKDIRETLESFIRLTYSDKEMLVVDDSTDKTPEIVKEYISRGVRLIRGQGKGCCEAVNRGIEEATGDVIINADADVRLPPDFLETLAGHYQAGADWVLVDSYTPNTENIFSRFLGAAHRADYAQADGMFYSEAFSCKRELAIKLGMFGPSYPARFCRDWLLGKKLTEAGYKKIYDPSLVVLHPQPDNFREYWQARKARGRFGPFLDYYMGGRSVLLIFLKLVAKDMVFVARFLLILPAALRVYRISRKSGRGMRDFFPFLWAYGIQELARVIGEREAFGNIIQYVIYSQ